LIIPLELEIAFQSNAAANTYFAALNNSTKKQILAWIASAKRPETRAQRLERTIESAAQQQNPLARPSGATR